MGIQTFSIQPMTITKFGEMKTGADTPSSFADILKNTIGEYQSLQHTVDVDSTALALGETDDLAQVQINSLKAQAALQTAVQLTSRAVSAYKEIMQMSI